MKAEVDKGCSVLTKKGFAHEGAILQEKDFSSPEVFRNLCDKSGKVKVLKEPEPAKEIEPAKVEESKPDESENKKEPEPETEKPQKKKSGPKSGAKRSK